MLPVVSHEVKTGRWPYVTVGLIGVNVLVFMFELSVGVRFVPFLQEWGLVPARVNAEITGHNLATVLTSMFLHVSVIHLVSNMWFLFVFGDVVEHALGRSWYAAVFLVSGFFGGVAILATSGGSPVPVVGASGAISGVMAASLVLWPRARLRLPGLLLLLFTGALTYEVLAARGTSVLVMAMAIVALSALLACLSARAAGGWVAGLLHGVQVPAVAVLALYLGIQVFNGLASLVDPAYGGSVGWWAHVGGFLAGASLAALAPRSLGLPGRGQAAGL